ncbi:sigma-54-dependent Fis family transcriptional regulator [Enterovibrio baiacu]|uniref:sigma-54-dependent Fis family transcriptional regulator n=1 Tax=Enterovibrio baiacu TaxID=2491023 RepID=UPI001011715F|nr:sigma-54-dependent Fis family transcriptional regulator [Enterovibrio baiacu]MBE1275515.1 sigma-54-dependent Fis family transcriptional regulator [Enterovibrio baiacu]
MSDMAHTHDEVIQASWHRCRSFGLTPKSSPEIIQLNRGDWQDAKARANDLIATTQEQVLPYYENILVNSNSLVLLADHEGTLLSQWGRPGFVGQMDKHLFENGTSWQEKYNGTNAVGTAIQTGESVVVGRDEHFLIANRYMTASAAPIYNSDRRLVGVLNISSDAYLPTSHVNGMVKVMTQAVENQLIIATYRQHNHMLIFNTSSDNLDSQWAGLLVFNEEGTIIAANRRADLLVGQALRGLSIDLVTGISPLHLSAHPENQTLSFIGLPKYRLFATVKHPQAAHIPRITAPAAFSHTKLNAVASSPASNAHSSSSSSVRILPMLDLGDAKMHRAIRQAQSVVNSDIPLVIQGETGVGKEVFAQAVHATSERASEKLVAVNCAAIPAELVESELFGYVKGAFTGANAKGSLGYIRQADGGTLFLDEIGDMPLHVQARLLRVLQEKSVTPLGSTDSYPVDFRIVCATHQSLRDAVAKKQFRDDLYYRVNGLTLFLPSLRERTDLRELVAELLMSLSEQGVAPMISDDVMSLFQAHPWPGNIRQLVNVLRVALALSDGDVITRLHLSDDFFLDLQSNDDSPAEVASIDRVAQGEAGHSEASAERLGSNQSEQGFPHYSHQPSASPIPSPWQDTLPALFRSTEGNISQIAQITGVSRNTIYKRLRKLGLK